MAHKEKKIKKSMSDDIQQSNQLRYMEKPSNPQSSPQKAGDASKNRSRSPSNPVVRNGASADGLLGEVRRVGPNLNLVNLQRKDPSIEDILFTAKHAVLYDMEPDVMSWRKKEIEGPLFIVKRRNLENQFIILNRLGVGRDFFQNIYSSMLIESQDPQFISFDLDSGILGLWFHDNQERDVAFALLTDLISQCSPSRAISPSSSSSSPSTTTSSASSASSASSSAAYSFTSLPGSSNPFLSLLSACGPQTVSVSHQHHQGMTVAELEQRLKGRSGPENSMASTTTSTVSTPSPSVSASVSASTAISASAAASASASVSVGAVPRSAANIGPAPQQMSKSIPSNNPSRTPESSIVQTNSTTRPQPTASTLVTSTAQPARVLLKPQDILSSSLPTVSAPVPPSVSSVSSIPPSISIPSSVPTGSTSCPTTPVISSTPSSPIVSRHPMSNHHPSLPSKAEFKQHLVQMLSDEQFLDMIYSYYCRRFSGGSL
eukprot:TRINITY_DN2105_c0_g1_i3.p1 TRINITY_DN2105_c0_g1~~TRINITY_DN2105_c0_g1_i3.p1  ORF type:complete len:488 (-),score=7.30 TRINITY_DN2105_c0_g1_i3:1149-2612(-)